MLKHLELRNVGPAASMDLELGARLNLLTGDNGLGKSFLLDIAWWALTGKWPAEVNPKLTAGRKALPMTDDAAQITFSCVADGKEQRHSNNFVRQRQAWDNPAGPAGPCGLGLVLYAMADGSFAVWDAARNDWRGRQGGAPQGWEVEGMAPAYVFSPPEVWDGLLGRDGKPACNGLIPDWAGWQKENGAAFRDLRAVLAALSPSPKEPMAPGALTRISLSDARDMPTVAMPYGQDVPLVHASAGMRRIMSLAYLLIWAWDEHKKAAKLLGQPTTRQVVFLIDEMESHLHPQWQRKIVPALFAAMDALIDKVAVQVIAATHSPLVMASAEPMFDPARDAWFDLDFERKKVVLTRRDFEKHGDAAGWLLSEAFDMKSGRPLEYEALVGKAAALLEKQVPSPAEIKKMHQKLVAALGEKDDFLFRWRYICRSKGWTE